MTLKISIIRHAEACERRPQETDLERELTSKGQSDAMQLGSLLKSKSIKFDWMMCSPAARTQTTAQLIALEISYPINEIVINKELYHTNPTDLLQLIKRTSNNFRSIALVGHNPTISNFANNLVKTEFGSFSPCTIAAIQLDFQNWSDLCLKSGHIEFIHSPSVL